MTLSKINANGIVSINTSQIAGGLGKVALDSASSTGNGAISVPYGNTATRPVNPDVGYVRFNTDYSALENYTGNVWFKVSIQQPIISSISGSIYSGNTSTITLSGSNFGTVANSVYVTISGANTATITNLTPTNGGASVSLQVPQAIYTIPAGSSVIVTITNADGATSGAYSTTVVGLPTGGTITSSGNSRIHTFTSSGTLTIPTNFIANVSYLLVAGGGGGGGGTAGGGGAGGLKIGYFPTALGTQPITIGAGAPSIFFGSVATNGSDSSIGSIATVVGGGAGGGAGASNNYAPVNGGMPGGSGGGGAIYFGYAMNSGTPTGSGTPGQGNPGGPFGPSSPSPTHQGGGGGGGGAGAAGAPGPAGVGGVGISSAISGSATYYAGGGGGSGGPPGVTPGGNGGGGSSGGFGGALATSGTVNTGGGGGANWTYSSPAPAGGGGSGIAIISYSL